jgi:hypothetical protein
MTDMKQQKRVHGTLQANGNYNIWFGKEKEMKSNH